MRYPIFYSILFSLLFIFQQVSAAPKREFRAVWIATVGNIDWPSKPGLASPQQQQEFINHLNFLQSHGFNAVIVQIRPAADAFYPSDIEPWSKYLTGKQGQPPFPKYDPLEFMIAECHKRNMEFHAWFNPYRALVASNSNPNPIKTPTRDHPDWLISYAGKSYFDPGNPQAREHILKVILDVVHRYDIDAVHIDDYFYPYPVAGLAFGDQRSYAIYGNGHSKEDWRRDNVNLFISQLNVNIKKEKSWVKFGVSPFGIWRNDNKDPEGSATRGSSCYDDLYSDVKLWIEQRWVDYVAPQLYWQHGHRVANFDVLLPWWKQHAGSRQLYIGLGIYNMVNAHSAPWNNPNEILAQIRDAREAHANGFVFYSMSCFYKIPAALSDSLQDNYFASIAIPPAMTWLDKVLPPAPVARIAVTNRGNLIQWDPVNAGKDPTKYLVYRFAPGAKMDLENGDNIVALTQANSFLDKDVSKHYQYIVTSLDRMWNESEKSNIISLKTP